jgi:general secretion pathway protein C
MNLAASLQGLPDLAAHSGVQRVVRHLPKAATAALIVLIAWQLAKLTWLLIPSPPIDSGVVLPPPVSQVQTTGRVNIQRVADAHLFGEASAADPADALNAPQTQMSLVLSGVMASPDPAYGFAFVGESAAMARFKRVGDPLPGGAKLHSVYADRVMLDRGGRLESLLLPRTDLATRISAPTPVATSRPPTAAPAQFAQNLRRIAETNPSAFNEIVRPQPVYDGATQRGYRVYPGRNRAQFVRLGLQPGDLVTAVNGTPLNDPSSSTQIFNTISTSDRVSLTIERNGQTQQLNINTAQIDLPEAGAGMPPQEATPPPGGANQMPVDIQ